jgi:parallel beta-helix repeat protein
MARLEEKAGIDGFFCYNKYICAGAVWIREAGLQMKRFLLIGTFILLCVQAQGRVLYVPADYSKIQLAINDANDWDTVRVSQGRYQENINFLGKAITVRSTDPNDPNIVAGTIIDGNAPADSNFGSVVTFNSGEDTNSVLSGFTITGGTGSWLLVSWEFRGLRWNRCGGGVLCYNMSAPTISRNIFTGNSAGQGGGIYIYGDPVNPNNPSNPPVHIRPIISDNTFTNNSAIIEHGFDDPDPNDPNIYDHGDGGAIVGFQGCDATITGNLIENNYAQWYGGGLHLRQWSNSQIENNRIIANESALGAGIHITYISSPTVRDNLIQANIAGGLGGGGIYVYYYSNPLIEKNTITQNESTNGAGIGVYWSSEPTIRNNLIYKNNSGQGIRMVSSLPTISHNTITDNYMAGIHCTSNSNPIIENNIITSNGLGWGIYVSTGSLPVIRYNNLWDNGSGTCGPDIPDQTGINGNISVAPNFINSDSNDYHLNYNSPCINAGDPNFVPAPNETDYDGDERLLGQYTDIGADEFRPVWNITSNNQYETIQQAIDDANDYDIIVVTIGTYTGTGNRDIKFLGKAITVQSIDPNNFDIVAATIIDPNGSESDQHRGFDFSNQEGPNSVLDGLTITNAGSSFYGGAIQCWNYSSPTIKNCIITQNSAQGRGGGIACIENSSPTITNCIITNNIATRGYGGGIACFNNSSPTITNGIITGNSAVGSGHHGGGIYCHDHSNATINNCIISGNTAGHRGGGLSAYWSSPTITNCTVIGNFSLEGGGISSFRESNPFVINCIVRDNIAADAADGNQLALISTLRVWPAFYPTEMTVSFSDIEGGQADACVDDGCTLNWGDGNIDIDPNFVNPGYWDDANTPAEPNDDYFVTGNYHLLPMSGCIDAGDNNSVPAYTDIDGEERIFNDTVDMGADEAVTHPADFNTDGIVDYLDIKVMTNEWLSSNGELQSDLFDDDFIDFADYTKLAKQWHWKGGWYE